MTAVEITTTVNIADIETDVAQRQLKLNLDASMLKQKSMTGAEVRDKLQRALRLYIQADDELQPKQGSFSSPAWGRRRTSSNWQRTLLPTRNCSNWRTRSEISG